MLSKVQTHRMTSPWPRVSRSGRWIGVAAIIAAQALFVSCKGDSGGSNDDSAPVDVIIDESGNGLGQTLAFPLRTIVDPTGNIYVSGYSSDNVFKITPLGVITEIFDATGDSKSDCERASDLAVDAVGNVFVACQSSNNVFKITPADVITGVIVITEVVEGPEDEAVCTFCNLNGIAVDAEGNLFLAATASDAVFKVTPLGVITEIISADGAGPGKLLDNPRSVAVDTNGNVYVAGEETDNVFKITPEEGVVEGVVTEILAATGDGLNTLDAPYEVVVGPDDHVYVAGRGSNNVFQVSPGGEITEITGRMSDAAALVIDSPTYLAIGESNILYVTGREDDVYQIGPGEPVERIIDGDGLRRSISVASDLAVDANGNLYLPGGGSDNAVQF
jgi:streptogramin lyase